MEIDPTFVEAKYNLAYVYHSEGDIEKAKQFLQKCVKIDKDFEIAKKNLQRLEELEK